MSDHEWIQRACSGDDHAFHQLIQRHYRTVQKFAFQLGVKPEDVEDITQDVFLKVYRSLASFSGGTFTTWLYAVTLNTARDMQRKQKRQQRNWEKLRDKETFKNTHEYMAVSEETWELHEMIQTLDDKYRIPLILHYFHDQTYKEISEVTGVSESGVKTRVRRARQQLKERFEKVGVHDE